MKGGGIDIAIGAATSSVETIKISRLDHQMQKWRRALESELVKNGINMHSGLPSVESEASCGGLPPQVTLAAEADAKTAELAPMPENFLTQPVANQPWVVSAERQLEISPTQRPANSINRLAGATAVEKQVSGRSSITLEQAATRLQMQMGKLADRNCWTMAKQDGGIVLAYSGPALAETEFLTMATLCCDLLKEQGVRVARIVNNGRIVFDQAGYNGESGPEFLADIANPEDNVVNRKF
jgi:hypothetical protein